MIRSLITRIVLVAATVALGLGLTLWLDGNRSRALTVLPSGSTLGADQALIYALRPSSEEGATEIYVSTDGSTWQALAGPVPGRVTHIAATPASPALVYAAGEQGLLVSTNAGRTWRKSALVLPATVTAIALDPLVPDLAYAATREQGLFKLTDGGQSVRLVGSDALAGAHIGRLLINPAESQIIYALTDRGLFRSTTAGETWSRPPGLFGSVAAFSLVPADPNLLFAGTRDGNLFRSIDAGATWERVNNGAGLEPGSSLAITALAQDPQRPQRIFVATAPVMGGGEQEPTPAGIFVSDDGGDRWARLARLDSGGEPVTLLIPLSHEPPAVRAGSAANLATYALDPGAAAEALDSNDPGERLAAARTLSLSATPDQAEVLLSHVDDGDPRVGIFVAHALGRLPAESVAPRLIARLEHSGDAPPIRLRLIVALGKMRAAAAVPMLQTILLTEPTLARPSADALAQIGTQFAWDALIEALAAREEPVYRAAGAALLAAGEPAVPALLTAMASPDPLLRARAAEALGWLRADVARDTLRRALGDESADVRAAAAFALGRLGERTALSQLQALQEADPSPEVRGAAARAIAAIQSARPSPAPAPRLMPAPGSRPLEALTGDPDGLPGWARALILTLTAAAAVLVLVGDRSRQPQVRHAG